MLFERLQEASAHCLCNKSDKLFIVNGTLKGTIWEALLQRKPVCFPDTSRGTLALPSPVTPYTTCLHALLQQSREISPSLHLLVHCKQPVSFWRVKSSRGRKQPCSHLAVGRNTSRSMQVLLDPVPRILACENWPCLACAAGAMFPPRLRAATAGPSSSWAGIWF